MTESQSHTQCARRNAGIETKEFQEEYRRRATESTTDTALHTSVNKPKSLRKKKTSENDVHDQEPPENKPKSFKKKETTSQKKRKLEAHQSSD